MRKRFWLEVALSLSTSLFLTLTLWKRDWLEACCGIDFDARSGTLETALMLASVTVALASFFLSSLELRRAFAARSAGY